MYNKELYIFYKNSTLVFYTFLRSWLDLSYHIQTIYFQLFINKLFRHKVEKGELNLLYCHLSSSLWLWKNYSLQGYADTKMVIYIFLTCEKRSQTIFSVLKIVNKLYNKARWQIWREAAKLGTSILQYSVARTPQVGKWKLQITLGAL